MLKLLLSYISKFKELTLKGHLTPGISHLFYTHYITEPLSSKLLTKREKKSTWMIFTYIISLNALFHEVEFYFLLIRETVAQRDDILLISFWSPNSISFHSGKWGCSCILDLFIDGFIYFTAHSCIYRLIGSTYRDLLILLVTWWAVIALHRLLNDTVLFILIYRLALESFISED